MEMLLLWICVLAAFTAVAFACVVLVCLVFLLVAACIYFASTRLTSGLPPQIDSQKASDRIASFRLVFAILGLCLLLGWVTLVPGALPNPIETYRTPTVTGFLGMGSLSVVIMVMLVSVLLHGSRWHRVVSAMILPLPLAFLSWAVYWSFLNL